MAGYSTTSRLLGKVSPLIKIGDPYNIDLNYSDILCNQTTTSYRTGGLEDLRNHTSGEIIRDAIDSNRFLKPYDSGHTFNTVKHSIRGNTLETQTVTVPKTKRKPSYRTEQLLGAKQYSMRTDLLPSMGIRGSLLPLPVHGTFLDVPDADLSIGTHLIKNTNPARPQANLSQFVGELLLDVPQLPLRFLEMPERVGTFKQALRSAEKHNYGHVAGDEILNVMFGWVPFVSDINKIMRAVLASDKILRQYYRDSAPKSVRRRRYLPPQVSFEQTNVDNFSYANRDQVPIMGLSSLNVRGYPFQDMFYGSSFDMTLTTTEIKSEQYSFSGSYSYLIDKNLEDKTNRYAAYANHLLGIRLTPDVLWELTPWSWLVDWWGDIGAILANATSLGFDGNVLKYCYLMKHSVFTRNYKLDNVNLIGDGIPNTITSQYITTRKERVKGTPYGFGVDLSGLSDDQWAILAAIGLTQGSSKHLRE